MPSEPIWPLADELIELNQSIVEDSGEPFSLLMPGQLESACGRPYNLWAYEHEWRISYLATSLIVGVARNHPFVQGNKRTAFVGALGFFQNNGQYLDHPDTEDFGPTLEAVIRGECEEGILAEELDEYLVETLI